jgi:hypothetical protein
MRQAWLGGLAALASVLVLAACSNNVVLRRRPDADTGPLGPFARCAAGERVCQDDPTYDGSRLATSHSTYFSLPNCAYGIQAILIQAAGSSDAVAIVRCAAPQPAPISGTGSELPTTTAGGTTQPR